MIWKPTIVSCVLAGCAMDKPLERVDVPMTLAALPALDIYFTRSLSDRLWNPGGNGFSGHLSYDRLGLVDEEAGIDGCATLDESLTASINGIPIEIFDRGHWPAEFPNEPCFEPSLGLHSIPGELQVDQATLVIADSTRSITAELGDVFLPRTAIPVGAEDWQFHPGDNLEILVEPISDMSNALPYVTFLGPTDPPHDHIEFEIEPAAITEGDTTIGFTLPDRTLEGTLFIDWFGGNPDVPCGDVPCHLNSGQRVYHHATIAP